MADESTTEWAFRGTVVLLFSVGAWLWNKLIDAVQGITRDMRKLETSIADHKLDAEKRYAKEDIVSDNFSKVTGTLNAVQNALNTNTNMTSIVMEKITSLSERINNHKT